ncbi:hypothetical protein H0A58_10530 [Alcaligenaceae bacterium]|nr:hypothetical protein [Alcaligenaceae bacterium]
MTAPSWGYERADCIGDFALSLFLDDIDTLITHYTEVANSAGADSLNSQAHHPEATVFQAQAAANKLLQAYQNNARKTDAFTNQHIDVKSVVDGNGVLLLVPIFSTGLKQHLLRLLDKSNKTSLH